MKLGCVSRIERPQAALDHGQLDHGEKVQRQLLVSRGDSAAALQPADAALHDVAAAVLAAADPQRLLIGAMRDHRLNAAAPEPASNAIDVVRAVASQSLWSSAPANPHRVHQSLEALGFVLLARSDQRAQRHAACISHQMKLRAKASAGSSQGVIFGLFAPFLRAPAAERSARMCEPSTLN